MKRCLMAYNTRTGGVRQRDFLAIVFESGKPRLWGTQSRRFHETGMLAFVGIEISEKDVFARLVDSGAVIENVRASLDAQSKYLQKLQAFKFGNVIRLIAGDGDEFELAKVSEGLKTEVVNLP